MNDALFTDEPAPEASLFTDAPSPDVSKEMQGSVMTKTHEIPTLSGLGKNALEDIKGLPGQAANIVEHPIETAKGIATFPYQLGKQIGGLGKQLGEEGVENTMADIGKTTYEKPVSTAINTGMNLTGALAIPEMAGNLALKGLAPAAAEVAPIAEEAAQAAPKVAQEVPPIAESPKVATPPPETPSGLPSEIQDYLNKAQEKVKGGIPENVKEFVSKKSEMPINQGTAGKYIKENARNMTMKVLGASPGQIRKIGLPQAEKLADFAQDKGIVNVKTGDIGAREKVAEMNRESGQVVGDMRQLAEQKGATHNMTKLLNDIHSELGDKYSYGMESGGQGSYMKALQEASKSIPTPEGVAKTITDLFHKAKEENIAAGIHKLGAPKGPYADVARALRNANENLIKKVLSPKELNIYHNALEDYGATTQIKEFQKMKQARDMGGRLPPGMGLTRAALQKGLDVVGYRGMAQIQNNIANWLKKNPEATTTPKELFRHYVDESADALDDLQEGMR
jgi:hypothetical protein